MHTGFGKQLFVPLFGAAIAAGLLVTPLASKAQSGGNTATGLNALLSNTTGYSNTADGYFALAYNTNGFANTATGFEALLYNTTGYVNTANGVGALLYNTSGHANTATGFEALDSNLTGYQNTADGAGALGNNTTGSFNTAEGYNALGINSTGSYNIALGYLGGEAITGSLNIDIGNQGLATDNGAIRIGTAPYHTSTYIAGIHGVTARGGVEVFVNANGQLGTVLSSRRFKNHIKDMGSISEKLMQLRPVTFRYRDSAEKGPHALQYGLIAEEVAKVYPDLVQYDKAGNPFTIYYHLLTPMLLNELQKEHRQNVALKRDVTAQNAKIAALKAAQAKIASLEAALHTQGSELAAVKQSQQQQMKLLTTLAATVQTAQNRPALQRAVFAVH
jgi:hypothetical protein